MKGRADAINPEVMFSFCGILVDMYILPYGHHDELIGK
jgi:hypothetical protein